MPRSLHAPTAQSDRPGRFAPRISANKKPRIARGHIYFRATGVPKNAPVVNYPHSPIRSMNDEIC